MSDLAPSRRGILAFLAAAPAVALPAMPTMPVVPSLTQMIAGKSWQGCLARYRAAEAAMVEAELRLETVTAECKAARGKLKVPEGLRWGWMFLGRSWLEMSVDEIREDLTIRRQGPNTKRKFALVNRDMKGVPEFKDAYSRAMYPRLKALDVRLDARDRFAEAEDALGEFEVSNMVELAEKMEIARDCGVEWLLERVQDDMRRLGGLA